MAQTPCRTTVERLRLLALAYFEEDEDYLSQRGLKKLTLEFFINGDSIEVRSAPERVRKE
jgi:hypothetical protein